MQTNYDCLQVRQITICDGLRMFYAATKIFVATRYDVAARYDVAENMSGAIVKKNPPQFSPLSLIQTYEFFNGILFQVFRLTGSFSYWESDIMQVNQAVVLLKFLPIAMSLVNFATAFIFMNSCRPCMLSNTRYVMVNCTRIMVLTSEENELKCKNKNSVNYDGSIYQNL